MYVISKNAHKKSTDPVRGHILGADCGAEGSTAASRRLWRGKAKWEAVRSLVDKDFSSMTNVYDSKINARKK